LDGKEDKGVEGQLDEGYKFANAAQGHAASLIRIDYFTVNVINHFYVRTPSMIYLRQQQAT